METQEITFIYHPTSGGYSGYSREIDGLNCEAATVQELAEKAKHLLEVRAESYAEIGKDEEAKKLRQCKIVLVED